MSMTQLFLIKGRSLFTMLDTLIINNLEFDHADIFPDLSYIYREFHNLIRTLKEEAEIIFPKDDLNISNVLNLGVLE